MKNKNFFEFKNITEMIDLLGLIETKAMYFNPEKKDTPVSSKDMEEILYHFSNGSEKSDWGRTIRNAREFFNQGEKSFQIQGDRRGTYFVRTKDGKLFPPDLKKSSTYEALVLIALAFMCKRKTVHWDIFHQLMQQPYPLGLITFLSIAIENKLVVKFKYKKDRTNTIEKFIEIVPGKISFKDGHWFFVGWERKKKTWTLFLIHSIIDIKPEKDSLRQYMQDLDTPTLDMNKFHEFSFGFAVLDVKKRNEFLISVPKENKEAVRKRRKEGSWTEKSNHWIWKIHSYDPDEIFTYIFKWNGILKLVSPPEMVKLFNDKLNTLIKLHS